MKRSAKRADGGEGAVERRALADVRLRGMRDRFADEERSAEERRRAVAYGRARGRLS